MPNNYNLHGDYPTWADYVYSRIDNQGFHYCFANYSKFDDVADAKFHELRQAYLESAQKLENYILANMEEDNR